MAEPRRADRGEEGDVAGSRILVVEARFYDDIADALLAGARRVLEAEGVAFDRVIRGDTIHFDIVAIQSARALMDIAVARSLPVGNGILTVDTEAQAWARARVEEAAKGGDAARAALAMVRIKRRLA